MTLNLERDPRITVLVYPKDDPYSYLEVRGTAELEDDPQKAYIEEMSRKYLGKPYPSHSDAEQRLVVRVRPDKVVLHG